MALITAINFFKWRINRVITHFVCPTVGGTFEAVFDRLKGIAKDMILGIR